MFFTPSKFAPMATVGGGRKGGGDDNPGPNVTDLLSKLNLTEEEGAVADFSDVDDDMDLLAVEWMLVGKVLSPMPVHVNTVRLAMKPGWFEIPGHWREG